MSLLSSLLEGSVHLQPSSLLFCESPKEQINPKNLVDSKPITKQLQKHSRQPSKSLTKMSLYSSNQKVDPKQRLLHRLAYKLQIKCRKHYYNFFVRLQNLYKKPSSLPVKKVQEKAKVKISSFVQKLSQIQSLLFSKYFEGSIKKSAFQCIKKYGYFKKGLRIICSTCDQVKKQYSWALLESYSKKIEKQRMRMEIFTTSVLHVLNSWTTYHKRQRLSEVWSYLFEHSRKQKEKQPKKIQNTRNQPLYKAPSSRRPQNSEVDQIYKAMKNRAQSRDKSPCKVASKINLNLGKTSRVSSVQQPNFLKAYKLDTKVIQQPLEGNFSKESHLQITKKCEKDPLKARQLNDLYDKNLLFFPFTVEEQRKLITESSVQQFELPDHRSSQCSFIHPLNDVLEDNRMSTVSKTGKTSTFGLDAVSFKNSLVSERQSFKNEDFLCQVQDKRQASFLKAKNFLRESRKVQEGSASKYQPKIKMESRYQSAEKQYVSSKNTTSHIVPFSDTLPLTLNVSNSQYSVAEPDYGKEPLTYRTSQADYPVNQEKERHRRSSFIKITKKI